MIFFWIFIVLIIGALIGLVIYFIIERNDSDSNYEILNNHYILKEEELSTTLNSKQDKVGKIGETFSEILFQKLRNPIYHNSIINRFKFFENKNLFENYNSVDWVSKEVYHNPFDFKIDNILIEVKTSKNSDTFFNFSKNESTFAEQNKQLYYFLILNKMPIVSLEDYDEKELFDLIMESDCQMYLISYETALEEFVFKENTGYVVRYTKFKNKI